jgi:hypothetical protein
MTPKEYLAMSPEDLLAVMEHLLVKIMLFWQREDRDIALRAARNGDWAAVDEYIAIGGRITPELRQLVAQKKSRKKHTMFQKHRRELGLAVSVLSARKGGKKNATEGRGLTSRQISRYLAKHRPLAENAVFMAELAKELASIAAKLKPSGRAKPEPRYRWGRATVAHTGRPDDIVVPTMTFVERKMS